jgi:recombination protein RecA
LTEAEKYKTLAQLSKTLDKKNDTTNSLVFLGANVGRRLPSISTGLPTLDYGVIGTGGLPKGRIMEVYGPESSGKTSFALHVIGQCQKAGGICAMIDAEHALDVSWAALLGVNVDKLLVSQPDNGEQALDIVDNLVESEVVDFIVVDSVSALVPAAELAGEIGDAHMGLQARLMSQALRVLTGKCYKKNCAILFVNQIRESIGVTYGSNEVTSGGRALKFFSSLRLDVRRKEEIKEGTTLIGHVIKVKAKKNKCGVPFKECFLELYYDTGFDKEGSLISYGDSIGVFEKAGAWFKLGGVNVANGLPAFKDLLKNDPKEFSKVKAAIEKKIEEGIEKVEV